MTKSLTIAALVAVSIGLSGCDTKTAAPAAEASNAAVPVAGKSGKATGTVTAIDAAAGTITLDHAAIPAVGWPPMTMGFSANSDLLAGITAGDEVDFEVTVTGSGGQVTAIAKQ